MQAVAAGLRAAQCLLLAVHYYRNMSLQQCFCICFLKGRVHDYNEEM